MGVVVTYDPSARGPGALAKITWGACQAVLEAANAGSAPTVERLSLWLQCLRAEPRATPALARIIDGTLAAATARLGQPAAAVRKGDVA